MSPLQDLLQHLGTDLAARLLVSNPQDNIKEAGCRELISPVLVAGVVLTGDIEMHAEFKVEGVQANGNVDWALIYNDLNIIVVEVRQNFKQNN